MRPLVAVVLTLGVLVAPLTAPAKPATKVARIGLLRSGAPPDPFVETFLTALRELGYVEGQNLSVEYRWTEGREERLPALAAELVRLGPDVIIASARAPALAAKHATTVIPIVMPIAGADPVGAGLVASLARPGGNLTGLATLSDDLPGKWIELLKEASPRASRVAVLWDPLMGIGPVRASEVAARSLGVALHVLKVVAPPELDRAFAEAQRAGVDGLVVLPSPSFYAHRSRLIDLAAKHRLPAVYHQKEFVVGAGGLMSYAADYHDLWRRAAGYVDRILRGAKPAELPVERPTQFELVVNLRAAKALGLTMPPPLLLRADELIR